LFIDAGARLVSDHGAAAVVLAGTDLNLAFDGHDTDYTVIDALDIHVDILAQLATGHITLEQAMGKTDV
jgi:aspartate racemase